MKPATLAYHKWDDVEVFLCKELGIKVDQFRDYHKVVGGEYKDWWHVWISITYDSIRNDSYDECWFEMLFDALDDEDIVKEYGEWIHALKAPLEKLQTEIGAESMMIHYSW